MAFIVNLPGARHDRARERERTRRLAEPAIQQPGGATAPPAPAPLLCPSRLSARVHNFGHEQVQRGSLALGLAARSLGASFLPPSALASSTGTPQWPATSTRRGCDAYRTSPRTCKIAQESNTSSSADRTRGGLVRSRGCAAQQLQRQARVRRTLPSSPRCASARGGRGPSIVRAPPRARPSPRGCRARGTATPTQRAAQRTPTAALALTPTASSTCGGSRRRASAMRCWPACTSWWRGGTRWGSSWASTRAPKSR